MTSISSSDREIVNSRIVNAPVDMVYAAFANPDHLKTWWGPAGFTNTIHQFDLRPGGKWILTILQAIFIWQTIPGKHALLIFIAKH